MLTPASHWREWNEFNRLGKGVGGGGGCAVHTNTRYHPMQNTIQNPSRCLHWKCYVFIWLYPNNALLYYLAERVTFQWRSTRGL